MTLFVTWKDWVYVPRDKKLREDIIQLHHDTTMTGHLGQYKTHELVTWNYWWPRLQNDIRLYVEGCEVCQRVKPRRTVLPSPLSPNRIPSRPWQIISVDLIGPLPESEGYDMALVIVNRFTKRAKFIAVSKEITSMGIVKKLHDHVFKDHGVPEVIISDRGTTFQ